MEKIKEIQLQALDRIGQALSDLEVMTDPMKIEAQIFFIQRLALHGYRSAHVANSAPGEWHDASCFVLTESEVSA